MKNIRIGLTAALATLTFACSAQAQNLKPGLWEMGTQMQSSSGEMEKAMAEMQKQLAAMPPEQRKQMQEMMAKQGVNMGGAAPGGGMRMQMCLTKEMVERNELPAQDGQCKSSYSARSGNSMKMSFVCTNPPSRGEGEVRFISPDAYTSKMTVTSAVRGKSETMTLNSDAKWLSAECGAVKPLGGAGK